MKNNISPTVYKIITVIIFIFIAISIIKGYIPDEDTVSLVNKNSNIEEININDNTEKNDMAENVIDDSSVTESNTDDSEYIEYKFRKKSLLDSHYEKHGIEMGFKDAKEYEKAASDVVNNPNSLHKLEAEDGDDVFYLEETNEFVIVSKDGYLRTYFCPDSGIKYYNKQ